MGSFFDLIAEILIKNLVGMPDASDFDLSSALNSFRTVMGYANYFFPFEAIDNIFSVWMVVITALTFGFLIVRMFRDAIPF